MNEYTKIITRYEVSFTCIGHKKKEEEKKI